MPRFSVVLPTHEHAETLPYSVQSVLAQTVGDFELLIVGDGVTQRTRGAAIALAASDPRITFFDLPKGEHHGESNRGEVTDQARGDFICYQSDDDLWFPSHLETMGELLEHADLAQAAQIIVDVAGRPSSFLFDANQFADAVGLRADVAGISNCGTGHRREAYERLQQRWPTAPDGIAADLFMWMTFLDQPWCRYASYKWPTSLRFPTVLRPRVSATEREAEISRWYGVVREGRLRDALCADVMRELTERMYASLRVAESALSALRLERLAYAPDRLAEFERKITNVHPGRQLPSLEYDYGTPLRFDRFGAGQRYIMYGFGLPEAWGTWIDGTRGELVLPLATGATGEHTLSLTYRCLVDRELSPEIRFAIFAGDHLVERIVERRGESCTLTCTLPSWQPLPVPHYLLRIVNENPVCPAHIGLSPDSRTLGVGLEQLTIEPR